MQSLSHDVGIGFVSVAIRGIKFRAASRLAQIYKLMGSKRSTGFNGAVGPRVHPCVWGLRPDLRDGPGQKIDTCAATRKRIKG